MNSFITVQEAHRWLEATDVEFIPEVEGTASGLSRHEAADFSSKLESTTNPTSLATTFVWAVVAATS
jgi:hypothetical protein